ncbi:hypothetical protein P691DRAFT_849910 [Macrolepiota fuliginosa MF-IS2]|uniref:Uncharacterized protein n=1 Tax=Macrolepiota fuliginosa MF-IS2 TaxID=1400762 RepID=A0A9P6BXU0_9AGAR|nr:hypothetical protein P691DRAFT_849910 [Macrolepiota fuliginosa MF-IS2]
MMTKKLKKLDTKLLPNTNDDQYIDIDEPSDGRSGGQCILPLLLDISHLCVLASDESIERVQCIASGGCKTTWAQPHDKSCILKHAAQCGYVALLEQGRYTIAALEYLAREAPDIATEARKKLGVPSMAVMKHAWNDSDDVRMPMQGPPIKWSETEPYLGSQKAPGASVFVVEGRKKLEEDANKALVDFIIGCGLSPQILRSPLFKEYSRTLNSFYQPPSKSKFEYRLVPQWAAAIRVGVLEHLKQLKNLVITFDGGKLLKKKFYSVHVTTVDRKSYCLELDDSTGLSMTADYIFELLNKNATKDIGGLTYFQEHMGITHGLQSIGETSECELENLGQILMPFACAIQCLEAKDTTPADVYMYWLAVIAQLNDIFTQDAERPELVWRITNICFSQIIESETTSNVYILAFFLDPDNHAAPILSNPNPLHIPSTIIARNEDGAIHIKPKSDWICEIGISLLQHLQNEYGGEYHPDWTICEVKAAMEKINPYLAQYMPKEAITSFKSQFDAYVAGEAPFNHQCQKNDTLWMFWQQYLDAGQEDAQAVAMKICSVIPISMVDKWAMSIIKWVNNFCKGWQEVVTVSNHLTVQNWTRINHQRARVTPAEETEQKESDGDDSGEGSEPVSERGGCKEMLEMLDHLRDLGDSEHPIPGPNMPGKGGHGFVLDPNFASSQYLDILADTPQVVLVEDDDNDREVRHTSVLHDANAAAYSIQDDEWTQW